MKITRNLGVLDSVLRAGIAGAMIYAGFFNQSLISDSVARLVLGTVGGFMLVVVLVGYCPMYDVIGFNTASRQDSDVR